jgi:uncharacterized membrane protein YccC
MNTHIAGLAGRISTAMRWPAKDQRWFPIRRALRPAVVCPVAFAIGSQVIGNAQVATLAAFGSFALLLFVEFPGNRASRAAAYGLLGITGAVLIVIGTYLATPAWLAVVGMAVVAFLVLFMGVISSITAAGGRAALLTFILPVMLPGTASDIPARLLGWAIAFAIAVPVALFVWPPQDQNKLRVRASELCYALGAMLHVGPPVPGAGDALVRVSRAIGDLRVAFRTTASRPVALSTGSRMLVRLVDELEWLTTTVANACADAPETWPDRALQLRTAASETLRVCGVVLGHDGSGPGEHGCRRLDTQIEALAAARNGVSEETLAGLRAASRGGAPLATLPSNDASIAAGASANGDVAVPAGEFERPLYAAHELGYVVALTAATVAVISAADSRSWFARLAGRRTVANEPGEAAAAERIAVGHLDRHSVWLQNSVRGAAGLAIAVLVARFSGQQEGFWIVLGALSVLRSNALSTGATALRAVAGTTAGFIVGGLLVAAIGTSSAVLWPILPFAIFIAAFAPELISFAVGQAAFTVVVIILFNIIAPTGWKIGVLRVEDVALGCVASFAAGALFWPRGAGAALGAALHDAYRAGAEYLRESVDYVTGRRSAAPDSHMAAAASGSRLDDALRQYLAERGAKHVPLEGVAALANGATRLRLAGTAVSRLRLENPDGGRDDLAEPIGLLVDQTATVTSWYHELGDAMAGQVEALPAVEATSSEASFLDVILPAVDRCGDPDRAVQAERLLWSGQYVGDVGVLRQDLVEPAGRIKSTRARPWWAR